MTVELKTVVYDVYDENDVVIATYAKEELALADVEYSRGEWSYAEREEVELYPD